MCHFTVHSVFPKGKLKGETPFCPEETSEEKPNWLCILLSGFSLPTKLLIPQTSFSHEVSFFF